MSPQYGERRPTTSWDRSGSLRHPCKFQRVSRLGSITARHLVVGVSQTLRRWTECATYVRQGDHDVGHWPTFLVHKNFTPSLYTPAMSNPVFLSSSVNLHSCNFSPPYQWHKFCLLTNDDKILINILCLEKTMHEFPARNWRSTLGYLMKHIDMMSNIDRKTGSGRPQSVRTAANIQLVNSLSIELGKFWYITHYSVPQEKQVNKSLKPSGFYWTTLYNSSGNQ